MTSPNSNVVRATAGERMWSSTFSSALSHDMESHAATRAAWGPFSSARKV